MASLNLKSLVGKLNQTCRRALESSAGLCLSRTNYNVEVEHWFMKLLEPADTDLPRILRHYEIDPARLNREMTKVLDGLNDYMTRHKVERLSDLIGAFDPTPSHGEHARNTQRAVP